MKKSFVIIGFLFAVFMTVLPMAACSVAAGAPEPTATPPHIVVPVTPSDTTGNVAGIAPPPAPLDTPGPYDVSVSISYQITLADGVKNTDPNIIRAARQGMYDWDSAAARLFHYQYAMSHDVLIFEVDQKDANTWRVLFHEKEPNEAAYPTDGYSVVVVEKQASGAYSGVIINPGGPMVRGDETY